MPMPAHAKRRQQTRNRQQQMQHIHDLETTISEQQQRIQALQREAGEREELAVGERDTSTKAIQVESSGETNATLA